MLLLGGVLTLTGFVVITVALLVLRTVVLDEGKIEKQLRAPGAHVLDFKVPTGMDPVALRVALSQEHFTSITRNDGGIERVSIACDEQDRERVRQVLEHVPAPGAVRPDDYLGQVRFNDEIEDASGSQKSGVATITRTAAEPIAYDVDKHEKRYFVSMTIRTVLFVAALLSIGHWFVWLFLVGALVLPYVAVIEAN